MLNNIRILSQLRKLFNEKQLADISAVVLRGEGSIGERKLALQKILKDFDWEPYRVQLGRLLAEQLPAEELVPETYADWKPIVHEAVTYIGGHLSIKRLLPKLLDQMLLPEDTPLEKRMVQFVAQMPSLQKLGQVIARNRNLQPELRAELTQLENDIHDVSYSEIRDQIEQQLSSRLATGQVKLDDALYAEASVCALLRFSWLNPETEQREQGVFKVVKPHIHEHFDEEMQLLQGLATHLDQQQAHVLDDVSLKETFGEIAGLLKQELDTRSEQTHLQEAHARHADITGLRIPDVIVPLCSDSITAMTYEPGIKATLAYRDDDKQREQLARQIVEALVAIPLFSADKEVLFHADPHAGNLYVDQQARHLILYDWALTGRLGIEERRRIILLFLGLYLRDEGMLVHTLVGLAQNKLSQRRQAEIKSHVQNFIYGLNVYQLPTMNDLLTLTDDMLLLGVRFSPAMMLFRKVLLTLDGVLHDVSDNTAMEKILSDHVLRHCRQELYGINGARCLQPDFKLPLSGSDTLSLAMSAQWYFYRTGMQAGNQMLRWFQPD